MKKFMIVALMAIVSANASAQFTHYVQGSITYLNMVGKDASQYGPSIFSDFSENREPNSLGIGFDVLYGFEMSLVNGLYWGVEAGIGNSRGFDSKYTESYTDMDTGTRTDLSFESNMRAYAIRILPANFGYRHKFNNKWAIDGHVGLGFSYDFAGSRSWKLDQTISKGGQTVPVKHEDADVKLSDIESYRPFDVYLKIGIGASYKHVGIDLSWQKGLNRTGRHEYMSASNATLGVRYIF